MVPERSRKGLDFTFYQERNVTSTKGSAYVLRNNCITEVWFLLIIDNIKKQNDEILNVMNLGCSNSEQSKPNLIK